MSRAVRLVLGLVALAAAGLALFLWLGTERGGSAPAPVGEARASTAPAEPRAPELALAEPPHAEGEDSPRSSVHARPGDDDVVPAPERLATIVGRVVAPPGEAEVNLASVRLSCTLAGDARDDPRYAAYARREFNDHEPFPIQPEPGGSFVLQGLPLGVPLELVVQHAWGPSLTERLAPFTAGEARELVLALDAGLTLAGRVEDEHGAPVAEVTVMVRPPDGYDGQRSMDTGADGRFRFARLGRAGVSRSSRRSSRATPDGPSTARATSSSSSSSSYGAAPSPARSCGRAESRRKESSRRAAPPRAGRRSSRAAPSRCAASRTGRTRSS